jgi:ABC-2 type transport system ATP-binding protein
VPQRREAAFLKQITLVMGQKQQLLWDLPPAETFALEPRHLRGPKKQFDETMGRALTSSSGWRRSWASRRASSPSVNG